MQPVPPAGEDDPVPADPERDWFGFPLDRPREAVPCPRCGVGFTDKVAYASHLVDAHDARPERRRRRRATPAQQPVPGRERRTPLALRLRTVPLALVLVVNVAVIVATLGALGAVDPPWWQELGDRSWSRFVVVPLLWPTALFLALRGVD
jgi:hypothetical protein